MQINDKVYFNVNIVNTSFDMCMYKTKQMQIKKLLLKVTMSYFSGFNFILNLLLS